MVPGRVAGVETGPVGPLRQNLITAADSGVRAFGGRTPEGRRAILVLIDGRLARTGHEGSSRAVGCTVSDQPNDARPVGTRQQRFQCPGAVPRPPGVPDLRRSCLLEAAEVVVEGGHFLGCGAAEVVELDPVEAAFSLRGLEAVDPGVLGGRHHPLACPAVPAGLAHPIPSALGRQYAISDRCVGAGRGRVVRGGERRPESRPSSTACLHRGGRAAAT